jgi:hypothetical protein
MNSTDGPTFVFRAPQPASRPQRPSKNALFKQNCLEPSLCGTSLPQMCRLAIRARNTGWLSLRRTRAHTCSLTSVSRFRPSFLFLAPVEDLPSRATPTGYAKRGNQKRCGRERTVRSLSRLTRHSKPLISRLFFRPVRASLTDPSVHRGRHGVPGGRSDIHCRVRKASSGWEHIRVQVRRCSRWSDGTRLPALRDRFDKPPRGSPGVTAGPPLRQ